MSSSIERVGVIGCGTMGSGICEVVARHGLEVVFVEVDDAAVERGYNQIEASLERLVARGRLEHDQQKDVLGRIAGTTDLGALEDRDLVVEAVPEDLALKQEVFARVDRNTADETILATNTSSLPVMDIAVHTRRPNRVVGFHFFNPAPVMHLIELVRTVVTDEAVLQAARSFAERIGKQPVVIGDRRGFIVNQLLFPYLNHAVAMVESGSATMQDVDTAMRLGCGHPMGPLALVDLVGLDTMLGIMEAIHDHFRQTRYAPQPAIRELSAAGHGGRKSGRGFYTYQQPGSGRVVAPQDPRPPPDETLIADWTAVGVVGTGTMATGISEVVARAGFDVYVCGRSREKAERVAAETARSLQRLVDKDRLSGQDMVAALGRIHPTDRLDDLAEVDLCIETVVEDLEVKREVLGRVDATVQPDALLATTTSSLPVIECAMATSRPHRLVGLHFFNPAPIMQLVEIVPSVRSEDEAVAQARAFVDRSGKVGVFSRDRAGFIVNALLFPYLNDAVKMLESHYATAEQIDTAMKLGCAHPMGPFELMDIVGLDVTLAIIERLHREFREPSYTPAPLLRHMVEAGFVGRKAGRGFYVYR